jgi:hypothetical protein
MMAVAAFALATGTQAKDHRTVGDVYAQGPLDVDIGPAPTVKQAEAAVLQYLRLVARDPYSVQDLQIGTPWFNANAKVHHDWIIPFVCNLKNGFGRMPELKQYNLCWKNGAIDIQAQQNLRFWDDFREQLARDAAGY